MEQSENIFSKHTRLGPNLLQVAFASGATSWDDLPYCECARKLVLGSVDPLLINPC